MYVIDNIKLKYEYDTFGILPIIKENYSEGMCGESTQYDLISKELNIFGDGEAIYDKIDDKYRECFFIYTFIFPF